MISFDWRIDYFNLDDSVLVNQYHIPRTFLSAQKAEVTMGFPILVQVWKFRSLPTLKSSSYFLVVLLLASETLSPRHNQEHLDIYVPGWKQ